MQLLDAHDANEVGATSNDLSANEAALHLFRVARGRCAAALLTISQFATFEYVFRAGSVKGTMGWTHRAHGTSPTVDPSSGVSASHPIPPPPCCPGVHSYAGREADGRGQAHLLLGTWKGGAIVTVLLLFPLQMSCESPKCH